MKGSGLNKGTVSTELEGYSTQENGKKQVAMFGVFDGHGGSFVSNYLKENLPKLLEEGNAGGVRKTIKEYRGHGGYLRRYRGGILERFREKSEDYDARDEMGIGLDEVCVLGFLQADNQVLASEESGKSGSVGTVALLHSLSSPSVPYQISPLILLTIAHLGDTTALLASTTGRVERLTQKHHPDSRVESTRLRKLGTGIVTDSFGESRWGGTLANTRGVGDREFKTLGVIAEPEITTKVIQGMLLNLSTF